MLERDAFVVFEFGSCCFCGPYLNRRIIETHDPMTKPQEFDIIVLFS